MNFSRSRRYRPFTASRIPLSLLIAAALVWIAQPVSARITRTRPSPSQTYSPLLPLTIGGSFEYESNDEAQQFDLPGLFEYNFSEKLRLTLEPDYVKINSRDEEVLPSASGFGDLETSLDYEFLRERRYRPALTAEAKIRWPTAQDPAVGADGTDYGLGLLLSKDFVYFDADLDLFYTFIGSEGEQDTLEIALAAEYPVNRYIGLIAEVVDTTRTGSAGPDGGGDNEFEGTVGFAWHLNRFLKIEQGVTLKNTGTRQLILSWEYSFAGEY